VTADVYSVVLDRDGQATEARRCLDSGEAVTAEAPGPKRAKDGVS
jgi:hypothetical protein